MLRILYLNLFVYVIDNGGRMVRSIFLMIMGGSFGVLTAAGVFTVLVAVGLVPRFAGKTHTASKVFLYEEMVVAGTLVGGVISIFPEYIRPMEFLQKHMEQLMWLWNGCGVLGQIVFGTFSGMFVGCLALAIAEMLDSIPIFARRVSFRHGLGLAVLSMALGKLSGSLFYFCNELHQVMEK